MVERSYSILSSREREILIQVGRGMTNQDIAKLLHMSIGNIKGFIHTACNKLRVANRRQAVIKSMRLGILTPQEIYSVEELAELLSHMDIATIEAVAPLLKQKLDGLQVQLQNFKLESLEV